MNVLRFSPVLGGLLKLWIRSMRYRFEGLDPVQELIDKGEYGVLALWHHDALSLSGLILHYDLPAAAAVSLSKDGELTSRVLQQLGMATARGSSSRGGIRALIGLMRLMQREKRFAALTVDGPRGPRHEVKDGALFLAHRAGVPIFPVRAFPRRKKVFDKAWDKFQLPMPFTTCRVCFGQPYMIEADKLTEESLEQERARLKQKLESLAPASS